MATKSQIYLSENDWEDAKSYDGQYTTIRVEFTDEDFEDFQQWSESVTDFDGMAKELLEGGYKFSVSYSGKTGSYFVGLSCSKRSLVNGGKTLQLECNSPTQGWKALVYGHYSLYREVWPIGKRSKVLRF